MSKYRSSAMRRYTIRLAISMSAYLITLALAVNIFEKGNASGLFAWLLAILPGLSVAGVFWAIGRLLVEEQDEFQRMLLVRQSLIASAFALSISTVWGFLENFGMVEHIDAFYIVVVWFIGFGIGRYINRYTLGEGSAA